MAGNDRKEKNSTQNHQDICYSSFRDARNPSIGLITKKYDYMGILQIGCFVLSKECVNLSSPAPQNEYVSTCQFHLCSAHSFEISGPEATRLWKGLSPHTEHLLKILNLKQLCHTARDHLHAVYSMPLSVSSTHVRLHREMVDVYCMQCMVCPRLFPRLMIDSTAKRLAFCQSTPSAAMIPKQRSDKCSYSHRSL